MAKYIDVDLLRKEIEKRFWDYGTPLHDDDVTTKVDEILSFIDNHQEEQPEVDLEEEITRWLNEGHITDTRFDDYDVADIETTARHFYELGLNTKKEESK